VEHLRLSLRQKLRRKHTAKTATTKAHDTMSKGSKILKGLLAGGAGITALVAVNAQIARGRRKRGEPVAEIEQTDAPPAKPDFSGEARIYSWSQADIFYRVAGSASAPPVVLIHDISAGASHFLWRRNFDELARDFQVFALDLPGFGASAKPPLAPYSADFYVAALADFLRHIVGRPAHLIASSLGAAFAIRAADEHKNLVGKLILLSPPIANLTRPGVSGAAFYGLLHSPVLGTSFYNAVASERSIRDHARKHLFYDKRLATDKLVAHLYRLSHQPGAQHATSAFLSGYLNTDVRAAFARLRSSVTVAWGADDDLNPATHAESFVRLNTTARLVVFKQARAWFQEECATEFNELVREQLTSTESKLAAIA
jgi:pimeloyl-ACP methyl ester carboxylesterase